jgi:hypothetical protein
MPSSLRSPSGSKQRPPSSEGERVFHLKYGNVNITAVDGNKLTTLFDKGAKSACWIVLWYSNLLGGFFKAIYHLGFVVRVPLRPI